MGVWALVEVVPALSVATSLGLCSSSSSSGASVRVLARGSGRWCQAGGVRALRGSCQTAEEEPGRSAFGRGSVSLRSSTRLDVRGQASKKTFSSFDDMLKNCEIPVLVDFYAVWCGPCQMMVPILNEVSDALQDKVRVVKIDTEKYPALASRFNIHALPTLVLFKDGQVADRIEGVLKSDDLVSRIQKAL